jgi:hypothetical protein
MVSARFDGQRVEGVDGASVSYLVLGALEDLCCRKVCEALEARGSVTRVLRNPLVDPCRFSWSFDTERSASSLAWNGDAPLPHDRVAGVLVRSGGWVEPSGWRPADLEYVQAETQAALLAWLWSLPCPVVNRSPPAIWYRPRPPLVAWYPLLRRAGLPTPETLVTNDESEARAFVRRLPAGGAVYGPLTGEARYLVTSEDDWRGVAALQRVTPVCLYEPHGEAVRAWVVGDRVIWDGEPALECAAWDRELRGFARASGLDVVEVAIASTARGACVVGVEAQPWLEGFGAESQGEIVDGIVRLLTGEARSSRSLV